MSHKLFNEIKRSLEDAIRLEQYLSKKGIEQMENHEMNLHQKLLKIANMTGALQRTKAAYGYKYVPEEDIQAKVTAGMQKYGVMLYHSVVPGTLNVVPITYTNKSNKTCNEVIVVKKMNQSSFMY